MNRFSIKQCFKDETDLLSFCYTDPEVNNIEHTHEFDELVIVDKGHGVHILNGALYFIQEGDVFLVKENDRHFYNELGTLKLMNIRINTRYQFQYLKNLNIIFNRLYVKNGSNFIWLMPRDKESCITLAEKIVDIYASTVVLNDEANLFQIESLFMQILSIIIASQCTVLKNNTQYKIRNLLTYLQQNYAGQINWQWLSEQFFITNKTMTRQIKELTGMSPVNYLNRLRVLSAREKLRQTDDLITEIAGNCGFVSSDYFAKCYRKNFGISPSDERRNMLLSSS